MQSCQEHDYAMEKPLRQLNPALHKRFILSLDPVEEDGLLQIKIVIEKMKRTLVDCRAAVCGRTSYTITQEDVSIEKHENSLSAESPRKKIRRKKP